MASTSGWACNRRCHPTLIIENIDGIPACIVGDNEGSQGVAEQAQRLGGVLLSIGVPLLSPRVGSCEETADQLVEHRDCRVSQRLFERDRCATIVARRRWH